MNGGGLRSYDYKSKERCNRNVLVSILNHKLGGKSRRSVAFPPSGSYDIQLAQRRVAICDLRVFSALCSQGLVKELPGFCKGDQCDPTMKNNKASLEFVKGLTNWNKQGSEINVRLNLQKNMLDQK